MAFNQLITRGEAPVEYHIYGRDCGPGQAPSKWVEANNLDANVFFHGHVEHAGLMKILPEYDILLHPALEESFGNTLIEAMACGLPVVAGKCAGAVPWVLNGGKNGMLVDVTSPEAIAEGIFRLINDKSLYEQLSQDGLEWVAKNFSPGAAAQAYIKLYEGIIKASESAGLSGC